MPDDPMTIIRKLLIEDQGVPEGKVTPDARILHDLGIDGDDASEVFEALHAKFGTDFTELNRQWSVFFGTEGVPLRAMLLGIPVIVVCASAAGALASALHWPNIVGIILTLAFLGGCVWLFSRWFGRNLRPVTVNGLVGIVHSGRWPANPEDVS